MVPKMRDIFICHASEDKEEIVRPLVEAFTQAGITCWYDETEIKWGDSITSMVNEGLAKSRFLIVVFRPSFIKKKWPQRELYAVLNQEASSGEVKILPLLVGSETEKHRILETFPLLNDKRYLTWDGNTRGIVADMKTLLGIEQKFNASSKPILGVKIPLPRISKKFNQRDKELFLRNSFGVINKYFQEALKELEKHYQEVETDFSEVHNFKILCTIFIRGEVANRCKIWLGGLMSSSSIAYHSGRFDLENDSSMSEVLSIEEGEQNLGFKAMLNMMSSSETKLLSPEQAAGYLWQKFTDNLG